MNDKTGGNRGPRRAGALAAAAAVALLATACGGSAPPSASASTSAYGQEIALAQCMRSHGLPDFPGPSASGGYGLAQNGSLTGAGGASVNINSPQVQTAYGDCRHVLSGAPSISQLEQQIQQAQQQQARELPALLKFEQCVRSHGEPDFSLPLGGQSPPSGPKPDTRSPQFKAALSACQHLLPPGVSFNTGTSTSSAAPSTPAS